MKSGGVPRTTTPKPSAPSPKILNAEAPTLNLPIVSIVVSFLVQLTFCRVTQKVNYNGDYRKTL